MRRRALSSGLMARDKIARAMQASAKGREARHDAGRVMHFPWKVKYESQKGHAARFHLAARSTLRQASLVRTTCAASALVAPRSFAATSRSRSRRAARESARRSMVVSFWGKGEEK